MATLADNGAKARTWSRGLLQAATDDALNERGADLDPVNGFDERQAYEDVLASQRAYINN